MFSILVLTLVILTVLSVSATSGTNTGKCNVNIPRGDYTFCGIGSRTCDVNNGFCTICIEGYDKENNCYVYGGWSCYGFCDNPGDADSGNQDTEAPSIALNSPSNGSVYSTRKVSLKVALNERAKIEYEDLISGRGRRSILCDSCSSASRDLSLRDGENRMRIWATDRLRNSDFQDVVFYVDSQKPRITTFGPSKGFSDGTFYILYTESNLKEIKLNYGNAMTGYRDEVLTGCESGQKQTCEASVNLTDYDGQTIDYVFSITDIASGITNSRRTKLIADGGFPAINSVDYVINSKRVKFTISVNESYLDKVTYMDNADLIQKEKRLCTKLVNGLCTKEDSFTYGIHEVIISVSDKAGNIVSSEPIEFEII